MDLNAIAIFNRVIKTGSFSKAASELGLTKSTVSKKITELEIVLGATLIRRTTRSLQLTDMGRQFYEQCGKALSEIKEATEIAQASSLEPQGILRITAPSDFANAVISPLLGSFLEQNPKVTIEMVSSDKTLDLVSDNIDVAIRLGRLSDSSLRAKRLGRDIFKFVASPRYLRKTSTLENLTDLKNHKCLLFAPRAEFRKFTLKSASGRAIYEPHPTFVANNVSAVKGLAISANGVALLPVSNCREEIERGILQIVLPKWSMEDAPVHLVYQKHLFMPPKIESFIIFMEKEMKPFFQ